MANFDSLQSELRFAKLSLEATDNLLGYCNKIISKMKRVLMQ